MKNAPVCIKWLILGGLLAILSGCANTVYAPRSNSAQQTTHLQVTEQVGVSWNR